jgi:hypothetical protein
MQVNQEAYESIGFFKLRTQLVKLMIENFPQLSVQSIDVLSHSIISKIQFGQIFSYDLENTIKIVFPVLMSKLNNFS